MRRQKLFATAFIVLTAGIFCFILHAQPPPETVTVTGTVLEIGTEQLVADLIVNLTSSPQEEGGTGWGGGQATTDERGEFRLEVPEGRYILSVDSWIYQPSSQELDVTVGMEPLPFIVQRKPRIRGQLRWAHGGLMAHTRIEMRWAHRDDSGRGRQGNWLGTTDEEGNYEVPVRQPGPYLLTLIVPDLGYERSVELTVDTPGLEGID